MRTVITKSPHPRPLTILLVEDDDGDFKAVKRAFAKAKIANTIVRAEDGVEALEYMRGDNEHVALQAPYIILVDLNMPRMNGIELVQEIRTDPQFKKAVIFMLTTSKRMEDKIAAYDLNVAGYIEKETAGRDFLSLVDMIDSFWRIVELPR